MKRAIIFLSLNLFFLIGSAGSGGLAHAAVISTDTARVSGLRGLYYDTTGDPLTRDERNSDIAAIRSDKTISFRWNDRTPPPASGDFFTAEWKGDLAPPATGTYAFVIISDGAAALWINDDLLIEGAPSELTRRTPGAHEYTHTPGSFFEVGRTYHLRIKTRHSRTNGLAQLWWRTPSGTWEIVPSAHLSTDAPASPLPAGNGTGASTSITQYIGDKTYRVSRTDPTVQIDLPTDFQYKGPFRFGVSWSGEIQPRLSTFYRFYASTDGPITFSLHGEDGNAKFSSSSEGPSDVRTDSVFLLAGKRYPFTMAYHQENGIARTRLLWSNALQPNKELIPRSQLYAPLRAQQQPKKQGTGLVGQYYNGEHFEQHAFSRLDPTINFNWKKSSPKPGPVKPNHFSVKWEGEIEAQKTDFYQFSSKVDDRIKLTVDGAILLDTLPVRAGKTNHALPILLESGRRYSIAIEYAQYIDTSYVNLLWSSSDGRRGVVPQEALYGSLAPRLKGTGLRGDYFDGENFQTLKARHPAEAVDFNWERGVPDQSVSADGFSVRWTGWIQAPATDDYTLTIKSDDGVRLWVGEKKLIDQWRKIPYEEFSAQKRMIAGERYPIKIEYFERSDIAAITLFWSRGKNGQQEVVPIASLYPEPLAEIEKKSGWGFPGTGNGLRGEYFNDKNLTSLYSARVDPTIDFNWEHSPPIAGGPADAFSVRWSGLIEPRSTENYTFTTRTDDGVRLWVDGRLLIDDWRALPFVEHSASIPMEVGHRYSIVMEYFEESYIAAAQLFWSTPTHTREIVPRTQFYAAEEPAQPRGNGVGLRGRYYTGADTAFQPALPPPTVERTDPFIDVNWGKEKSHNSIPADNFSVMWEGFIHPQYSGVSTFYLLADDGAQLFIDESPITTATRPLLTTGSERREYSAPKNLSRDRLYYIRVVYREQIGDASVRLSWSHARIPKEIVPRSQLYPPTMSILAPLGVK